jgi:outer membrane protein assembly factor BamB
MRSDEIFNPDTVDDQVDQLASLSRSAAQSPNARVVRVLSALYEEEIRSTERVWERLVPYISEYETSVQTLHEQRDTLDEASDTMLQQKKPVQRLRRDTQPSRLALIAAALFAALLTSSLLWVLYMAHSSQVGHGPQATTRSHSIYILDQEGLYKLDGQTRQVLWRVKHHFKNEPLSGPRIIGNTAYLVDENPYSTIIAVDTDKGAVRWSHTLNIINVTHGLPQPYQSGDMLYFSGIPFSKGSPIDPRQVVLYAINPTDGSIKATYKPPRGGWMGLQVTDNILYYTSGSGLYALQLPGGTQLWHASVNFQVPGLYVKSGILYAEENLAGSQTSQYDDIYAFNARTGKVLWHQRIVPGNSDGLYFNGSVVYAKAGVLTPDPRASLNGTLYAFNARTGNSLWQSAVIPGGVKTVAFTSASVFVSSYGGNVYTFDVHSGKLVWHQPFDAYDMLATSDALYLNYNIHGTGDHGFAALRAKDGAKLWQRSIFGFNGFSHLTLIDGVLYSVGGGDAGSALYAFSTSTGSVRWTLTLDTEAVEIV